MSDQEQGRKSGFGLDGARKALEDKGGAYKDRLEDAARDLSGDSGRDQEEQQASRSGRDISREDRDDIAGEDRKLGESLDADEGRMKSSQGQQGDPLREQNRREMDRFLDPSDS